MTESFLQWLKERIAEGQEHSFYLTGEWRGLREEIIKDDRNECQICKGRGECAGAVLVHHVNHLKEHPELALDKWYIDADGNRHRNLISVCRDCHETVCHPERMRVHKAERFNQAERWD